MFVRTTTVTTSGAHVPTCLTASSLASVCAACRFQGHRVSYISNADCAMTRIIEFSAPLGQKAGKGKWNDLDMLEIGNGGMTFDEYGEDNTSATVRPEI